MYRVLPVVVSVSIIALNGLISQASAECLNVKGKVNNNTQPDGSTLGVVNLKLGKEKLKCGIVGKPQLSILPSFKDTLVCDNEAALSEAQAQVTFNTSFLSEPTVSGICPQGSPGGPVSFSFEEISVPDPATARGAFQGVTEEGSFTITGEFNCAGGIEMKIKGMMCFNNNN